MSQLDASIEDAVFSHDDASNIIANFNKLYCGAVYPPVEELQTYLLVAAVESKHLELVKVLVNIGFPVNYKFGYPSPSPLHAAVSVGDASLVKLLLLHNASVNVISRASLRPSSRVYSAIEFALLSDRPDLLCLLESSFSVGQSGYTLLHLACKHGSVECLRQLLALDQYRAIIDAVDNTPGRCTALMLSLKHGANVVKLMLDYGASVDKYTADYKCTILHLAASREWYAENSMRGFVPMNFSNVIRMLVAAGCSVNAVDMCGETALSLLCDHAHSEAIMFSGNMDLAELPYELSLHRSIILEATEVLLKAGALACGSGSQNLPLGVLTRQIQILLGLLAQSDEPMESVEHALVTCHKMIVLVLSYCEHSLNGWRPELVAVNLMDMLHKYCLKVMPVKSSYGCEFVDKIVFVVLDIFRILVLLGATSAIQALTTSIYHCLVINPQQFVPFLQMMINVVHETDCHFVKHNLRTLMSANGDTDMLYIVDSFNRPRSLRQLSRVTVLTWLAPVRRMLDVTCLNLPPRLVDYVILLND